MTPDILLIEDDDDIRALVTEVLETEGYALKVSPNGREAIEFLQSAEIKAPMTVLLDLSLPDIDGSAVMQFINTLSTRKFLRVLLCSGWHDLQEKVKNFGADGCIRKPYDLDQFIQKVKAN